MNNTVLSYYTKIEDNKFSKESSELLYFWRKNWTEKGWKPVVLNEKYARNHPLLKSASLDIDDLEGNLYKYSTNTSSYLIHCYLRWFAFHRYVMEHDSTCWADYDVYNRNFTFEDFESDGNTKIFCPSGCAGVLSKESGDEITQMFKKIQLTKDLDQIDLPSQEQREYIINCVKEKCLSDMLLMQMLMRKTLHRITSSLKEENYKEYSLFHFHGGFLKKRLDSIKIPNAKQRTRMQIINLCIKHYLS